MLKVVMVTEHSDGELFVMYIFDDIETVVGEVDSNFEALGYNPYFTSRYEMLKRYEAKARLFTRTKEHYIETLNKFLEWVDKDD